MNENRFQHDLIRTLRDQYPGCMILKLDACYKPGIPDLLILYKNKWAVLECKKSIKSYHRPNQDYYVSMLDQMSFARFIFPENKEEVLRDLQTTFRA